MALSSPGFLKIAEWAERHERPARGFSTPFSADTGDGLAHVIANDIFGDVLGDDPSRPVTRDMAMRQPAVARGRGILLTLARYPLVAYQRERRLEAQPKWLYRTDTTVPPQVRMERTMDDLIFHGKSLWIVLRAESETGTGKILDAMRMPMDSWRDTTDGGIEVSTGDGEWSEPLPTSSYLRFESFQDGFLTMGALVVRTGEGIQRAIAGRALSPIPMIDLHLQEGLALSDKEKKALRAQWSAARRSPEGAVAITPSSVEARVLGSDSSEFLDQARNSQRIDTANALQIPASLLDGTTSTASLTYSTQEGRRVEFHDYGLNLWRTVIESRLSMDDASPKGQRIEIDLSELLQVPDDGAGPTLED